MMAPSRSLLHRAAMAFSVAGLAASVLRRSAFRRFPALSLTDRLAMLPVAGDVSTPITIRWNHAHVPFVEADSLRDAAVGLGVVHGHLRLAQMEVMRRAATGRIAEVAGPAALEVDRLLRLIDFPRAREASLAMMAPATRDWAEGFAAGISAAAATHPPPEFDILGIRPEPWSVDDLFAVARLASADYAWKVWRTLSDMRREPGWADLWLDLIGEAGAAGAPAAAGEDVPITAETLTEALPTALTRTGSNAWAVDGSRTASGTPILACDPHLLLVTPNVWLVAGFRTPEAAVWGLMIPALPIFAPGRNEDGAWGGTNLHAQSSELVDVSHMPLTERRDEVPVRGQRARPVRLRESALGPVVSDAGPFALPGETVALHWMGHRASDEFGAFHEMMRAGDAASFQDALDGYALPGLNMIWAGNDGTVAKFIAVHVPRRPLAPPQDMIVSAADTSAQWERLATVRDLPQEVAPERGFVVSANEAPEGSPVTISLFYSADFRARRVGEALASRTDHTAEGMMALQRDVAFPAAKAIAARLAETCAERKIAAPVVDAMAGWDGDYAAESRGALAFEAVAGALLDALEPRLPAKVAAPFWQPFSRLSRTVTAAPADMLGEALGEAVPRAQTAFAAADSWGEVHRVRLQHPLGRLPWLRGRLASVDIPSPGSNETVQKALHPHGAAPHAVGFGANARFVADLSDPDATFVLLLGGQDGWPGSATLHDQVAPWQRGEMMRLPFTSVRLAEAFPHVTTLRPADD